LVQFSTKKKFSFISYNFPWVQDGSDGLTRMKAKLLKRYLAKSDHKHRFQDFTDASRDKNGKFNVLVRP
jgi:hypothetical protein